MKKDKSIKNKALFYTGIVLIVVNVTLMAGNFMGDSTSPIILATMGIVFIGASKYRLLK